MSSKAFTGFTIQSVPHKGEERLFIFGPRTSLIPYEQEMDVIDTTFELSSDKEGDFLEWYHMDKDLMEMHYGN